MNTVTKGLIGAGALVLGVDGGGANDVSEEGVTAGLRAKEALAFAYDFQPEVPFEVVGRLAQPKTNAIVTRSSALEDHDEYTAYLVLYMPDTSGKYALVFTKETALRPGTTYRFDTDVRVFDTDLNLLSAPIRVVRRAEETTATTGTGQTTATNETATNETTTTNETTVEVVVNGETTTESG